MTSCSRSVPASASSPRYLADRVAHVHAVELDRSLAPHLAALAARPNVDLHWGDALRSTSPRSIRRRRSSSRTCPYNVATPIVAESLDRPARASSSGGDGAAGGRRPLLRRPLRRRRTAPSRCSSSSRPSAPASIRSRAPSSGRRRTSTRRSSPSGAYRCPDDFARIKQVVDAVVRAPSQDAPELGRARRSRARVTQRRRARSDRPAPRRPVRKRSPLASSSRSPRPCESAGAGQDQSRPRGRPARARTASTRSRPCSSGSTSPTASRSPPARGLSVTGFADDTLVRDALDRSRGSCRRRATVGGDDHEANPGRGRARRRQLRRRDRASARERDAGQRRSCRDDLRALAATLGADVPFFLGRRPAARTRRRLRARAARATAGLLDRARAPARRRQGVDRGRLRRFDERDGGAGWEQRRARLEHGARGSAAPARPRGAATERPRLLAARGRLAPATAPSAPTSAAPARPSTASSTTGATRRRRRRALRSAGRPC